MLVYYTKKNIGQTYLAWCTQQSINDSTLSLFNNVTKKEYCIVFANKANAVSFLELLKNGCMLDKIIKSLESEGYNGIDLYAFLMQNGLIE